MNSRTSKYLFLFVAGLIMLASGAVSQAAPLCSQVHSSIGQNALQFSDLSKIEDLLTRKMLSESERKLKAIQTQQKSIIEVDNVVIGAGLHASIFSATAAQNHRSQGLLVLEGGKVISKVFGQMGGTFIINSRETPTASTNTFNGSPVQMKELSPDKFPNSLAMSVMAASAQYSSNVPVLFDNPVTSITKTNGESPYRYRLETSTGLTVYSNQIFFGTGLGAASVPLKDPATLALVQKFAEFSQKHPNRLLSVMLADDFHRTLKLQAHADLKAQTEGKSFAVIGQGDGGKIAIEAMLSRFSKNIRIDWIGLPVQTREEYENFTWERYHTIAPFIEKTVFGKPGRAESISKSASGKFIVRYDSGKSVEVDHVILATGFRDVIPDLVKGLNGNSEVEVSKVPVRNQETVIGSQVAINGKAQEGLYIIGPAAGALATEAELKKTMTENPVAIEVLGPRTAEMTKLLISKTSIGQLLKSAVSAASFEIALSKNPNLRSISKDSLKILLKLEITKALRQVSKTDLSMVRIEIHPQNTGALVSFYSTQKSALEPIQKSIESNVFLQSLVHEIFERRSERIAIEIPVQKQNLALADMKIQTSL